MNMRPRVSLLSRWDVDPTNGSGARPLRHQAQEHDTINLRQIRPPTNWAIALVLSYFRLPHRFNASSNVLVASQRTFHSLSNTVFSFSLENMFASSLIALAALPAAFAAVSVRGNDMPNRLQLRFSGADDQPHC